MNLELYGNSMVGIGNARTIKEQLLKYMDNDEMDDATLASFTVRARRISKGIDEAIKANKSAIGDAVANEIAKDGAKVLTIDGSEIQDTTVKSVTDFTVCEHPVYDAMQKSMVELKGVIKTMEGVLKGTVSNEPKPVDVPTFLYTYLQFADSTTEMYNMLLDTVGDNDAVTINQPAVIKTQGLKYLKL